MNPIKEAVLAYGQKTYGAKPDNPFPESLSFHKEDTLYRIWLPFPHIIHYFCLIFIPRLTLYDESCS